MKQTNLQKQFLFQYEINFLNKLKSKIFKVFFYLSFLIIFSSTQLSEAINSSNNLIIDNENNQEISKKGGRGGGRGRKRAKKRKSRNKKSKKGSIADNVERNKESIKKAAKERAKKAKERKAAKKNKIEKDSNNVSN